MMSKNFFLFIGTVETAARFMSSQSATQYNHITALLKVKDAFLKAYTDLLGTLAGQCSDPHTVWKSFYAALDDQAITFCETVKEMQNTVPEWSFMDGFLIHLMDSFVNAAALPQAKNILAAALGPDYSWGSTFTSTKP